MNSYLKNSKFKIVFWLTILVLVFQLTALSTFANPPTWYVKFRQVKILETSRTEVEKLFGNPPVSYESIGENGISIEYRIKGVNLTVEFSLKECSLLNAPFRKLAKDTVIEIDVELDDPKEISRFALDLSSYKKVEIGDVKGLFTFSKPDEIVTANADKLHSISVSLIPEQDLTDCD